VKFADDAKPYPLDCLVHPNISEASTFYKTIEALLSGPFVLIVAIFPIIVVFFLPLAFCESRELSLR